MKYIRTKYGSIVKVYADRGSLLECENGKNLTVCQKKDIVKQADTIEELCDELVFEWHRSSISHDNDTWHLYHEISLKEEIENAMSDGFRADMEDVKNIYGAIWADKGLIYVAKMNEKGELELL